MCNCRSLGTEYMQCRGLKEINLKGICNYCRFDNLLNIMNILTLHIIHISSISLGRNLNGSKCNGISYIFDNFHHIGNKYLMNGLTHTHTILANPIIPPHFLQPPPNTPDTPHPHLPHTPSHTSYKPLHCHCSPNNLYPGISNIDHFEW